MEFDLQLLKDSYDWTEAFRYATKPRRPVTSPDIDNSAVLMDDIEECIGMAEGDNDGPDWLIAGRLKDGRWFMLRAGCDYTGWDCQAGGDCDVATTCEELIRFCMAPEERERLGQKLDEPVPIP